MLTKKRPFQITLYDTQQNCVSFPGNPETSIFKSALNAGYQMAASCLQARCTQCRSRLLEGSVHSLLSPYAHPVEEPVDRKDNCILICSVAPLEDVKVQPLNPWYDLRDMDIPFFKKT